MKKNRKQKVTTSTENNIIEAEVLRPKKNNFFLELFESTKGQYLIITVFIFLLYGNTLSHKYALDDRLMITDNAFTKKGIGGIKDILTNDSFVGFFGEKKNLLTGGRYRPLSHVMFAVEYQFFGLNPFIGHLLNILLYSLSCIVLLIVLRRLFQNYKGYWKYMPLIITVLFAAHPLHTEIVANIKGRDDILSFLFSVSAMYFILNHLDKKGIYNLFLAFLMYFLALMAKENSITFLGVVPLLMFYFFKLKFKDYILPVLSVGLAAFIFILLRFAVLGFELNYGIEKELLNNPFVNSSMSEKFATIFYTMGLYIKLLFIPHPLTHDYYPFHIEMVSWASPKALISLLIYLFLGIYAIWGVLKKQLPALGVAIYLITFSIASNIVFNIGTFMNERFMYVPLLGFCIVLSYFIIYFSLKAKSNQVLIKNIVLYAVLFIIFLYSIRTISRNVVWKDDFTLFTSDVKVSVNSAKVNVSAGGVLIEQSQKTEDPVLKETYLNQAVNYLSHGVEIHPRYVAAWVLYGNAFLYLEKFNEAYVCYDNALNIAPSNKDALQNMSHLAQLLNNKGFYDFSIKAFGRLDKTKPLNHENKYQLSRAYEGKNSMDTAVSILLEILNEDSVYYDAHSKLGELYGKVFNNLDKSLYHLLKAYEIKPDDASNLENIGIAYGMKRDFTRSLFFFEEAMRLNPDKAELYFNVSQTYAIMGDFKKAEEYNNKAQQLRAQNFNK